MPLILFLVVCWGLFNAVKDTGTRIASRPPSGRHGLSDYLSEAWHGFWEQQARALSAARNAKDLDGDGRVSWRERWTAARTVLKRGAARVVEGAQVAGRAIADSPLVRPVGERPRPEPAEAPTAETDNPEPDLPAAGPPPEGRHAAPEPDTTEPAMQQPEGDAMTAPVPAATAAAPTGEATGVAGGAAQAQAIRLAVLALREQTLARIEQLARALETLEASAAGMEIDPKTMAEIARAREALAAFKAALSGTTEEVTSGMTAVEREFTKHLPGVELNAAVGGLARNTAYQGN